MSRRNLMLASLAGIAGIAGIAGVAVAGVAVGSSPADDVVTYPTTARGTTYGQLSDFGAARNWDEHMPDLVRVVGVKGLVGYVKTSELFQPEPSSPAEALKAQAQATGSRAIGVYDLDGRLIDSFVVANGSIGATESNDAGGAEK